MCPQYGVDTAAWSRTCTLIPERRRRSTRSGTPVAGFAGPLESTWRATSHRSSKSRPSGRGHPIRTCRVGGIDVHAR
jgi:hypothetical protein